MNLTLHLTHAVPTSQPQSVAQIAQRILPAYTVDRGRVHLAGCILEDRPFARLSYRTAQGAVELFVAPDGRRLEPREVQCLRLEHWAPLEKPPQATAALDHLLAVGIASVEQHLPPGNDYELASITVLWCKFAEGKVRFSIGEHSSDLPFADWAQALKPPPYVCPSTGVSTFHVTLTDEGRIVAQESLACCDETGRRVSSDELVTCSATGRQVIAELTKVCPVSGQPVLATEMVPCDTCCQAVSPTVVKRGRCVACRNLHGVDKSDPRMVRVLQAFPELDRWSHWQISETSAVYVLLASTWVKRLLIVVDKGSLELRIVATGGRLLSRWEVIPPAQHRYVLGG